MQIFWKAYFFFWLALFGVIILASFAWPEGMKPWETYDYIEAVLWLVGILGLYGFSFRRGFGKANYWKVIFIIILAVEVVYPAVELLREWSPVAEEESNGLSLFLLAALVLMVPYYIGLYLYGWRSKALWEPES